MHPCDQMSADLEGLDGTRLEESCSGMTTSSRAPGAALLATVRLEHLCAEVRRAALLAAWALWNGSGSDAQPAEALCLLVMASRWGAMRSTTAS